MFGRYTKALDSIKALRKDRMAELKAEKERLESLSREKSHADKLKSRVSALKTDIGSKEFDYEVAKEEYEKLVAANQKFYDSATKFRETYTRVENLENTKARFEADLADAKENLQELSGLYAKMQSISAAFAYYCKTGTDDDLATRLRNFDDHIVDQRRKKRSQESKQQDHEERLASTRKAHVEQMAIQGRLQAQLRVKDHSFWCLY